MKNDTAKCLVMAAHRRKTNLVIECVVKHQSELLPGHVRVCVHHLEPVHIPVGGYSIKSEERYMNKGFHELTKS